MKTGFLILNLNIFLFCLLGGLFSQSNYSVETETSVSDGQNVEKYESLPSGYSGIKLGMVLEKVEDALFEDPNFSYRGAPDVTMLPQTDRQVIDCDGVTNVKHAYFQFNDNKLYIITIVMNPEYIDHYSIYSALKKKYGPPEYLDPSKTIWRNDNVEISLERPLSIKYIDRKVFEKLQAESHAEKSTESILRQEFIDSF
ncbi:MAG: hypothetical protein PQJ46_12660 [Spirochaetales bacterium]|nr:hypothetical protein [Spirochaetales bacterium]